MKRLLPIIMLVVLLVTAAQTTNQIPETTTEVNQSMTEFRHKFGTFYSSDGRAGFNTVINSNDKITIGNDYIRDSSDVGTMGNNLYIEDASHPTMGNLMDFSLVIKGSIVNWDQHAGFTAGEQCAITVSLGEEAWDGSSDNEYTITLSLGATLTARITRKINFNVEDITTGAFTIIQDTTELGSTINFTIYSRIDTTNEVWDMKVNIVDSNAVYDGSWVTLANQTAFDEVATGTNPDNWYTPRVSMVNDRLDDLVEMRLHDIIVETDPIAVGAYPPIVSGLDLGTASIKEIKTTWLGEGGGAGSIIVSDPGLLNFSTLLSNTGNIVKIYDKQYEDLKFHGEVATVKRLSSKTVELTLIAWIRKTTRQPCNHNPIAYAGNVLGVIGDYIGGGDTNPFDPLAYISSPAVTLLKNDTSKVKCFVSNIQELNTPVAGSIDSLYQPDRDIQLQYNDTIEDWTQQFEFDIYLRDKDDLDTLDIDFIGGFPMLNGGYEGNRPTIKIYNYNTTSYETLHTFSDDDTNGGDGTLFDYTQNFSISTTPENYLEAQGTANISGFIKYRMIMQYNTGEAILSGALTADWYFSYISATANMRTEQVPGIGLGILDASMTSSKLIFDNSLSWVPADFPAADGIGGDDTFYLTKFIGDVIDDVFTLASTSFIVERNITGDDEQVTAVRDLTDESLFDFLSDVASVMNAKVWLEEAIVKIYSIDNLQTLSITLGNSDFVTQPSYTEDGTNLYGQVIIRGQYESKSETTTLEYGLEGGSETLIVYDELLVIQREIDKKASSLALKHSNTSKEIIVELDYRNPNQSYQGIALYRKIGVQLANEAGTVLRNFTSGNLGLLTIEAIDYFYTQTKERVRLTLRRLYS